MILVGCLLLMCVVCCFLVVCCLLFVARRWLVFVGRCLLFVV